MGVLDFLKRKSFNPGVLAFFNPRSAPLMKENEYNLAYKGWVYACVNAISEEVGSLKLKLMQKTNDEPVEVEDHPAVNLLRNMNSTMTSSDVFTATQGYLELNGNEFWYIPSNMNGSKPTEIWPLNPSKVTVVKGETSLVAGYIYLNPKGAEVPLDVKEVLHFKRWNPNDQYRGMGTIQAAATAIDIDNYSADWNKNFFFNSAMPSGVLSTTSPLTTEQYERLKEAWKTRYQGVENAHRTAILEGGMTYSRVSMTQKEMDFLEQRRYTRDEILGIFRVPKSILGIVEDVNRANAEATEYIFAKRVIKPRMQFIADRLNEFYLPLFGLDQNKYYFEFEDPVPQNRELELRERESGINSGYMTPNEAREEIGLDPIEGGDELKNINASPFSFQDPNADPNADPNQDNAPPKKNPPPNPDDNQDEPPQKSARKITKSLEKVVENRIKYINSEIKKRKGTFKTIYLGQKDYLVSRIKSKKSIKAAGDELVDYVFEDWEDQIDILKEAINDTLKASLAHSGKAALAQLGLEMSFDLENPRVIAWLQDNVVRHARSVANTVKDEVGKLIIAGVEAGKGAADIASAIAGYFDEGAGWKALRVARSEVVNGYAQGSKEGYKQSGVVQKKAWLTNGVDPCPECEENADEGEIPLEQDFQSGDDVPGAHPNCRCVILPVVDD
jgi:HK97 family phage portal protein